MRPELKVVPNVTPKAEHRNRFATGFAWFMSVMCVVAATDAVGAAELAVWVFGALGFGALAAMVRS